MNPLSTPLCTLSIKLHNYFVAHTHNYINTSLPYSINRVSKFSRKQNLDVCSVKMRGVQGICVMIFELWIIFIHYFITQDVLKGKKLLLTVKYSYIYVTTNSFQAGRLYWVLKLAET